MKNKGLKLSVVKAKDVPHAAVFTRSLLRPSIYTQALLECQNSDGVVKIADDPGQVAQIKKAAEKLKVEILFARVDGEIYVQVAKASEAQRRLMLLLRESRTFQFLEAQKLECSLSDELKSLTERGLAKLDQRTGWKLTEAGAARL